MNTVLYWIGALLWLYGAILFVRAILSWVVLLGNYRPSGALAVLFEFVYSVTDPPLRALHRVVPDIRIGNAAVDLSFLVLIIGVFIVAGVLMRG